MVDKVSHLRVFLCTHLLFCLQGLYSLTTGPLQAHQQAPQSPLFWSLALPHMLTLSRLLGPLMACSLVACSVTLPVQGNIQSSAETFEGTATGHIDRSGELKVKTSKGVECTGKFVYVTEREGSGVFKCADGRTGPFEFSSTGMRGTGKGELDGGKFTFMFGD